MYSSAAGLVEGSFVGCDVEAFLDVVHSPWDGALGLLPCLSLLPLLVDQSLRVRCPFSADFGCYYYYCCCC